MELRLLQEELEERILGQYAIKSIDTRGRQREEPKCDIRTDFQRDRDRILHCKSFRRMKHKTQVFLSLVDEVANEGRGVIVMVPEIALTPQMISILKPGRLRSANPISVSVTMMWSQIPKPRKATGSFRCPSSYARKSRTTSKACMVPSMTAESSLYPSTP